MRRTEFVTFALAAISFAVWLLAKFAVVPVEDSYFLIATMVFFLIGFISVTVQYARAVAPEWNEPNG